MEIWHNESGGMLLNGFQFLYNYSSLYEEMKQLRTAWLHKALITIKLSMPFSQMKDKIELIGFLTCVIYVRLFKDNVKSKVTPIYLAL